MGLSKDDRRRAVFSNPGVNALSQQQYNIHQKYILFRNLWRFSR